MGNAESLGNTDARFQRSVVPSASQKRIEESLTVFDTLSDRQISYPSRSASVCASSAAAVTTEKQPNLKEKGGAGDSSLGKCLSEIAASSPLHSSSILVMPKVATELPVGIFRDDENELPECPTPFQSMSGERNEVVGLATPDTTELFSRLSASVNSNTIGEKTPRIDWDNLQHRRPFNSYLEASRRIPPSLIALEDIVKCRMGPAVPGIHPNTPVDSDGSRQELPQNSTGSRVLGYSANSREVSPLSAGGSNKVVQGPKSSLKSICRVSQLRRQWNYESLQDSGFLPTPVKDETPPLPVLLRRDVGGRLYSDLKDGKHSFLVSTSSSDMNSPLQQFSNGTHKRVTRRHVHRPQPPPSVGNDNESKSCSNASSSLFTHTKPKLSVDVGVGTEESAVPPDISNIPFRNPDTALEEMLESVQSIACTLLKWKNEIRALSRRVDDAQQAPVGESKTAPTSDSFLSRCTCCSHPTSCSLKALSNQHIVLNGPNELEAKARLSCLKSPLHIEAIPDIQKDACAVQLGECNSTHQSVSGTPRSNTLNGGLAVSMPQKLRPFKKVTHWVQKSIKRVRGFPKSELSKPCR